MTCPIVSEHATAFMSLKTAACTNLSSGLVYKSYFCSVILCRSFMLFIYFFWFVIIFWLRPSPFFGLTPNHPYPQYRHWCKLCAVQKDTEDWLPLWICSLLPIKHFRACLFFSAIKWHFWFLLSLRFTVTPNVLHCNLHNGSSSGVSIFFPYIT